MRIDYTLYNKDTMMMRFMSAIALLMVFAVTYTAAQEELTPLEKYQKSQQHSLAVDKRITARQTVLSSIDEATLLQAYEDLLRFSQTDEQKTDALTVLEEAVGRANPETNSYRQGMLTKGKLLKRLGRDDESLALFQDAIQSQWLHAVWRYSESLIDAGELDKACQLEYDRVIGEGDYAHYCAEKEDFFIFITLLRLMKSDNPDAKAMELVFPALEDSAASPQAKAIAQALCLVQDEQYDEAITLLKQVDVALTQSRESDKNAVVDEYRNTPLYLTTALLFQGTDLDTAREAYGEFIKRNDGNWKHIYDRSMRVVRDLTILPENNSKIPIVTQQMLSSNIINDDEIKHLFSDDEIASIYDLHQLGLYNLGMVDEAAQIQNFVIEKYYPHTLAGANCALNKALYTAWRGNDLETAKNILIDILIEADFQEIVPWVKVSLAHIEYRKENYQTALELVNDVVNLVDDNQKGTIVKCRENALELKQLLIAK